MRNYLIIVLSIVIASCSGYGTEKKMQDEKQQNNHPNKPNDHQTTIGYSEYVQNFEYHKRDTGSYPNFHTDIMTKSDVLEFSGDGLKEHEELEEDDLKKGQFSDKIFSKFFGVYNTMLDNGDIDQQTNITFFEIGPGKGLFLKRSFMTLKRWSKSSDPIKKNFAHRFRYYMLERSLIFVEEIENMITLLYNNDNNYRMHIQIFSGNAYSPWPESIYEELGKNKNSVLFCFGHEILDCAGGDKYLQLYGEIDKEPKLDILKSKITDGNKEIYGKEEESLKPDETWAKKELKPIYEYGEKFYREFRTSSYFRPHFEGLVNYIKRIPINKQIIIFNDYGRSNIYDIFILGHPAFWENDNKTIFGGLPLKYLLGSLYYSPDKKYLDIAEGYTEVVRHLLNIDFHKTVQQGFKNFLIEDEEQTKEDQNEEDQEDQDTKNKYRYLIKLLAFGGNTRQFYTENDVRKYLKTILEFRYIEGVDLTHTINFNSLYNAFMYGLWEDKGFYKFSWFGNMKDFYDNTDINNVKNDDPFRTMVYQTNNLKNVFDEMNYFGNEEPELPDLIVNSLFSVESELPTNNLKNVFDEMNYFGNEESELPDLIVNSLFSVASKLPIKQYSRVDSEQFHLNMKKLFNQLKENGNEYFTIMKSKLVYKDQPDSLVEFSLACTFKFYKAALKLIPTDVTIPMNLARVFYHSVNAKELPNHEIDSSIDLLNWSKTLLQNERQSYEDPDKKLETIEKMLGIVKKLKNKIENN